MDRRLAWQVIRSSGYLIPVEREEEIESHSGWFSRRRPSMEGGLNSLPYLRAVPPSAFRAASRSYWCPRMMPRLCSAASEDISNLKLQGSGSGCFQFATRLTASLSASVGGLGLRYVDVGGLVFVRAGDLLIFLFSSSVILVLSSRRCWVVVARLRVFVSVSSVEGAVGYRMMSWDGSIGARLDGVSMVSSAVKSEGLFGGGILGGTVGRSSSARDLGFSLLLFGAEAAGLFLVFGG
jgi:hypothetical protein